MISVEKPGSPEEILEHVGIKGMKWGVRKAEDTSAQKEAKAKSEVSKWSKKKQTRVENRAKGHDAQANKAQIEIDKIKSNPSKWFLVQRGRNARIQELEKHRDIQIKAAKDLRSGHLTDFQKHAIIGASVVGTVLAAYGTYKLVDSGAGNQLLTRRTSFKRNAELARKMKPYEIFDKVVEPINPNYGGLGTKMNCRRATFAYEMRRRGLDVKATKTVRATGQTPAGLLNAINPKSELNTTLPGHIIESLKDGSPVHEIIKTGDGLGKQRVAINAPGYTSARDTARSIYEAIGNHSDGARGELGVGWFSGGAHSMAWEVIDGKPVVIDNQTGKMFLNAADFEKYAPNIKTAAITRLDNVNLNTGFLRRWVTNV